MLKTLSIHNLVLVEEAYLEFDSGLTVITGETGAGKTALIEALRLIMGERADASKVRKGSEKAHIRASFEGVFNPEIREIFEISGIIFPEDEPLIISREISTEGKNRAFVSGQVVPLSFLGKTAPFLIDFVGQHAQILLKNHDQQRDFLDQFGEINLGAFQASFHDEKGKKAIIDRLKKEKDEVNLDTLASDLKQLESLGYTDSEEEVLFEEFSLLTNSEEITAHCISVVELADRAMGLCHDIEKHLDKLPLIEGMEMAKEAHLQLSELERLTHSLKAKIDLNPNRLNYLEKRLNAIDQAKKRFGKNLLEAQDLLSQKLETLSQIDDAIEEAQRQLTTAKEQTDREAKKLTESREKTAKTFSEQLSLKLQNLNIEAAQVQIAVTSALRTTMGNDQIDFLLRANTGEKMTHVKESSSGGEISRLLFCIKSILVNKVGKIGLVFDEIDAGVGGKTASLMGDQLQHLGKDRQVFCVTHFPQVARYGNHHIKVTKYEREGRTLCKMEKLEDREREAEYLRMIGGAKSRAIPSYAKK